MDKKRALEILGFSSNDKPTEQEIKKAFKKRAAKLHPDVNKAENAEDQFKELNAAKDFLLNPPAEAPGSFNPFDFVDFDPFNWGPKVRYNRTKLRANLRISFNDSVLGSRQTINVERDGRCKGCVCSECNGLGSKETITTRGYMTFTNRYPCTECKGTGRKSENCTACSGQGVVKENAQFSFKLNGGIKNGTVLNLRGFGNVENHQGMLITGDLELYIFVDPDKDMKIDGMDVISNIDISLLDAIKGTKKTVRTVLGNKEINIKRNTKHKDVVALNNHGVEKHGSHIFIINVMYPKDTTKLIEALEDK